MKKIHLYDAAFIGDNLTLSLDVPQHLWDGGRGETDVWKRYVEEKEVPGMWSRASVIMAKMMRRFPMKVTRYMNWKSQKRRGCNNTSSESPRRINSEIRVWFHIASETAEIETGTVQI